MFHLPTIPQHGLPSSRVLKWNLETAGPNENLDKLDAEGKARVAGVTEWWQQSRWGNTRQKEVNYTAQVGLYTEAMFGGYIYIMQIRRKLDEGK